MKHPEFFFRFTRSQRLGIFILIIIMAVIQAGYYLIRANPDIASNIRDAEERQWLAHQAAIDELKAKTVKPAYKLYPFNPNFITDYKGYTLGMSVAEIDRLHKFRETGKYVNSAEDFQKVTRVHDTLLKKMSPYFKFPDWVKNRKEKENKNSAGRQSEAKPYFKYKDAPAGKEKKITVLNINDALEEDLVKVYGIGPAFAKMILRRRAQLGAFVSMEQMDDFTALTPEANAGLKKGFRVIGQPDVIRLNINTASLNQLTYFPYFNKSLAKAIITRRSMKGRINKFEELLEINDFPVQKEKIIALYLEF